MYCAAIWWAASHGQVSLCRALLRHGARADIGEDPLKQARKREILNMLCENRKVGLLENSAPNLIIFCRSAQNCIWNRKGLIHKRIHWIPFSPSLN